MTATDDDGTSPGADVASDAGAGAKGRLRTFVAAVVRSLYVDPFTKLTKMVGISVKRVVLWYFFAVLVVAAPAALRKRPA